MKPGPKARPVAERFWPLVDKSAGPDGCWPFRGGVQSAGYGQFRVSGTTELAHRVAWVLGNGSIEPGKYILHDDRLCSTKLCCNYRRHLREGTQSDNMREFFKLVHRKQRKPSKALAVA